MRGRKPNPLALSEEQRKLLARIANNLSRPYYAVIRAKVLLAIYGGERVKHIAARFSLNVATIWRIEQAFIHESFKSLEPRLPVSKKPILDLWAGYSPPVPLPAEFDDLVIDWG